MSKNTLKEKQSFQKKKFELKRFLPPTLYMLVTFRFSFPKLLRGLFIPGYINKNNNFKRCRVTGLYGVFESFNEVKNNLWDGKAVTKSRVDQLAAISHEKIVMSDLQKSDAMLSFLINNLLCEKDCRVLDFGGASGHTYYLVEQHRQGSGSLSWNVVDLPNVSDVGERYAKDNDFEKISFHESIESVTPGDIDIVYSNAVLQYIEDAYAFIQKMLLSKAEYIFYARLPLHEEVSYITSQTIVGLETAYHVFCMEDFFEIHRKHGYELVLCTSCSSYKDMNCDIPKELEIPCDRNIVFRKQK